MTTLHARIMNIPSADNRLAYRLGHRDARHAAAELANEADAHIEALTAEIERLRGALRATESLLDKAVTLVPDQDDLRRVLRAAAAAGATDYDGPVRTSWLNVRATLPAEERA